MKRALRWLLGLCLLLALGLALLAANARPFFVWLMTPTVAFDARTPPRAPDYEDDANWTALPGRADAADALPRGEDTPADPLPADVFYIHPTSYVGSNWNAPVDDPVLNAATDAVATRIQASAFNACCAVYGPRYRQTNGLPLFNFTADADAAQTLAWHDIRRAFGAFILRRGAQDRPFILAAHSQGTMMAMRLLEEVITGSPIREQLAVAYLIGGAITEARLKDRVPDVPPCRAADDVHCVVAFNARRSDYRPHELEMPSRDGQARLCTNPLSWADPRAAAPASANLGAVFLDSADTRPRPSFADAQCVGDTLLVREIAPVPREGLSRVLDFVLGSGNLHPIEYQVFYMNLRENANRRVSAMLAARPAVAPPAPSDTPPG